MSSVHDLPAFMPRACGRAVKFPVAPYASVATMLVEAYYAAIRALTWA